jgi:hypothetical protein
MRENGPLDRIRVAESPEGGMTWGPVGVADLPNPSSGLDAVRLHNGHWLLVYNDTTKGRHGVRFRSLRMKANPGNGRVIWKISRAARSINPPSFRTATAPFTPFTATLSLVERA